LITLAYDGQDGFKKATELIPDCILLDIRMPKGENGLTFLRRLRAFRDEDVDKQLRIRKIPVVILTGAGDQMKSLFQQEGISDYIDKPFDSENLKNRILKVI
jgi:CheY-like chemotaxis protein